MVVVEVLMKIADVGADGVVVDDCVDDGFRCDLCSCE